MNPFGGPSAARRLLWRDSFTLVSPGQTSDHVRDKILEALDFAAGSLALKASRLHWNPPPRPERVMTVKCRWSCQTPGAQIGQRGDQLIVTLKGEDVRKIPGQQVLGNLLLWCSPDDRASKSGHRR